jgi:hypothetical protein
VANTGPRAGSEVVQVYVAPRAPRLPRPPKELKAFAKVRARSPANAPLTLELEPKGLRRWDRDAGAGVVDPGDYDVLAGRSAGDIRLSAGSASAREIAEREGLGSGRKGRRTMIRIGVLGAAKIAPRALMDPVRDRKDAKVTCVAARDPERARHYANEHGIAEVAQDYADLVARDDIDLVYVGAARLAPRRVVDRAPWRPARRCCARSPSP